MTEPEPFSREHRQAERQRQTRLSRLPFLYDYALRGSREAVLATLVQAALVLGVVLVPATVRTGRWLPGGITFVVLAAALGTTWLCRYLNARAGRR